MRTHEYRLTQIPRGLYTLRLLAVLLVALVLPFLVLVIIEVKANLILILSFSFGIAYLLFKLSGRLVRNELEVEIRRDLLAILETSSITKKKVKREIEWDNLKSYIFEPTQYYHILKLYTIEGKKIMFTLDHDSQDLPRFEKDFYNKVSKVNENSSSNISLKPSIYETNAGLAMALILGLMMIGWPIAAWLGGKDFQIGLAVIFYSGAGFFIYMVVQSRNRKRVSN